MGAEKFQTEETEIVPKQSPAEQSFERFFDALGSDFTTEHILDVVEQEIVALGAETKQKLKEIEQKKNIAQEIGTLEQEIESTIALLAQNLDTLQHDGYIEHAEDKAALESMHQMLEKAKLRLLFTAYFTGYNTRIGRLERQTGRDINNKHRIESAALQGIMTKTLLEHRNVVGEVEGDLDQIGEEKLGAEEYMKLKLATFGVAQVADHYEQNGQTVHIPPAVIDAEYETDLILVQKETDDLAARQLDKLFSRHYSRNEIDALPPNVKKYITFVQVKSHQAMNRGYDNAPLDKISEKIRFKKESEPYFASQDKSSSIALFTYNPKNDETSANSDGVPLKMANTRELWGTDVRKAESFFRAQCAPKGYNGVTAHVTVPMREKDPYDKYRN